MQTIKTAAKERQKEHAGTAPGKPKTVTQLIAPVKGETAEKVGNSKAPSATSGIN